MSVSQASGLDGLVPDLTRPHRTAGLAATVLSIAGRTVRKYLRTPELVVFAFMGSAVFMLLFRYVMAGSIHMGQVRYVDFLVPGFVMTSVLVTGTGVATAVADDIEQGVFDRFRSLPVPRIGLALGRVIGDTTIIAVTLAATAALGFLVGFHLHGTIAQGLLAYGLCIAFGFAFLWVFACLGLYAGSPQGAQGLSFIAYIPMFFSSAFVRPATLPSWARALAEHQPVTFMVNAVRSLAFGNASPAGLAHTTGYWTVWALVWTAGIILVFAPLAARRYRRVD
ncbi:MAG TPA: ABC transporter permease [Streptosporangiaceae bacterium]|jgi:ABC-2 type transport system permease protein|nr:ABC transporter permease [Streptosporangiaceae bacterium]